MSSRLDSTLASGTAVFTLMATGLQVPPGEAGSPYSGRQRPDMRARPAPALPGLTVVPAPLTTLRRASLAEGGFPLPTQGPALHFEQILKPLFCGPFPSLGVLVEPLNLTGSLAGPDQCHLPQQPWGLRAAFKHPPATAPTAPRLGQADSAASRMAFLSLDWQGCCQLQWDESQTGRMGAPSSNSPEPPRLGALSRPRKELPGSP